MASSTSSMALLTFVVLALLVNGAFGNIIFEVKSLDEKKLEMAVKGADTEISEVDLKDKGGEFEGLTKSGDVWTLDSSKPLKGPFSIRLTNSAGGHRVEDDVIPAGAAAGSSYPTSLKL
ncbi:hypothetical protein ACP4OV_005572 [Aristida adscensionis]